MDQVKNVPQQDRAIRTRFRVLQAAAAEFDEHGYGETTIKQIAEKAGVSQGALYFHFDSKEELARAVLDAQFGEVQVAPQPVKLQELVDTSYVLAYKLRDDPILRGASSLAMEQGKKFLDRRRSMDAWNEFAANLLTEARERGEILETVNIEKTAWNLVASFAGIQNMSQEYTRRQDLTARLTDMWEKDMPNIALPALLRKLQIHESRGEELVMQAERSGPSFSADA
ncbi:ScbR family autoregulator-binding transcription factor [Streptomyces sp. Edi2]|uniref:ScbR family autoregulator-binding transcription factor n=1 Tax=Streptomyces sp. Edi2 TaxID=3162528 RepID=UPI003305A2CB